MTDDAVTIRCVCGWEVTGAAAEVVPVTIEHGRRLHNMEATPEQVLAMATSPRGDAPVAAEADAS